MVPRLPTGTVTFLFTDIVERIWHDQATTEAREQLGAEAFKRHFREGRQTGPQEASDLVLETLSAKTPDR